VHDEKHSEVRTHAKKQEPLLIGRVIRVIVDEGLVIKEGRFGLIERDAMFAKIRLALCLVPFEPHFYLGHDNAITV
jgi:hypothetical protein